MFVIFSGNYLFEYRHERIGFSRHHYASTLQKQLEACLQSLSFCDEFVVDSGSNDETIALAHRYNAKVIEQAWLGFGKQKQFAVKQAKHDWVLCIDSDERISAELRSSIEKVLQQPQATDLSHATQQ